ncbi:MAG: hypothetical protein LUC98_13685 [Lachnospiraceae bacterium]|nr:hypothetical protein [Lachnospiraceae bacterium]
MKKKRRYHANPIFMASSVLLCMVLLTTWMTFGLFARYTSDGGSTSSATVAVMASNVTVTLDNILLYPGIDYGPIEVTLTNEEDSAVCEVAQSYSFQVSQLTNDLPLTVTVYSDRNCTNNVADARQDVKGTFPAAEKQTATYYIKVTWDETKNAKAYASEIDYLQLSVTATQID